MTLLQDPDRQRKELSCRSLLLATKANESCRAGRDAGSHRYATAAMFSIQDISGFRIIDVHFFDLVCHFTVSRNRDQVLKSFCSGKRDKGDFVAMSLALVMVPCFRWWPGMHMHEMLMMHELSHRKLPRLQLTD